VDRRTFLAGSVAVPAVAAVTEAIAGAAARAAAPGAIVNRAPLRPDAFLRLAPGRTRAGGWLATQLGHQLTGLNGRMTEVSHFLRYDETGWIHPELNGWEEVPYWLKGFSSLGYVTGDDRVIAETKRWIDGVLATQAADGFFGPARLRTALNNGPDLWPHMPMLHAVRTFQEFTGDARILPFLTASGGPTPWRWCSGPTTAPATRSCSTWPARSTSTRRTT